MTKYMLILILLMQSMTAHGALTRTPAKMLDPTLLTTISPHVVTNKDIDGGTASNTSRITLPKAATSTLNGLTRKAGTIVYDTTLSVPFYDNGTTLIQVGAGTSNITAQKFSGNGASTTVTLSAAPGAKENTNVYVSGVYQQKDTYSLSGTTITFSTAPPAGTDNIEVVFGSTLAAGVPADGTISTAKINDSAVTTAKIADLAVTTIKLADGSVTQAKLGTLTAPTIQTFLTAGSSGTYTPPAGVKWIRVRMVGGGAGGGAVGTGATNPTAGGASLFGTNSAGGGAAPVSGAGGGGGSGGTPSLSAGSGFGLEGANGQNGYWTADSNGGDGGSSFFGGRGQGGYRGFGGAAAMSYTGSGGGGAGGNSSSSGSAGGGAGAYLDFIVTNPSATSFTVGQKGNGGGAGTGGYAGGAGAGGIITIEEHYN